MADAADISVLFFSAGANFWAILGHFWANLGNFGSFLGYILGHFRSFLGNFLVLIFVAKYASVLFKSLFATLTQSDSDTLHWSGLHSVKEIGHAALHWSALLDSRRLLTPFELKFSQESISTSTHI